jgi:hypothetical protein
VTNLETWELASVCHSIDRLLVDLKEVSQALDREDRFVHLAAHLSFRVSHVRWWAG